MTNPSLRQWVVVGENDEEVTKNSILRYTLKIVLFVIVVQPMLNYAALKHGREYLMENVTLYDVGFGQKLVLYWRWKTHRDMMFLYSMSKKTPLKEMCDFLTLKMLPLALLPLVDQNKKSPSF